MNMAIFEAILSQNNKKNAIFGVEIAEIDQFLSQKLSKRVKNCQKLSKITNKFQKKSENDSETLIACKNMFFLLANMDYFRPFLSGKISKSNG